MIIAEESIRIAKAKARGFPDELPDKPSQLIRTALADLRFCEENKDKFVINMGSWFSRFIDSDDVSRCHVCLAGATLAARGFDTDVACGAYPNWFSESLQNKLEALDLFRQGYVRSALSGLGIELPDGVPRTIGMPLLYSSSRNVFHEALEDMANMLERYGL